VDSLQSHLRLGLRSGCAFVPKGGKWSDFLGFSWGFSANFQSFPLCGSPLQIPPQDPLVPLISSEVLQGIRSIPNDGDEGSHPQVAEFLEPSPVTEGD
jgi:hypothetical protein